LKGHDANKGDEDDAVEEPAKKRLKMTKITVPCDRILHYAEEVHQDHLRDITCKIDLEKAQERERILSELDDKMQAKLTTAKKEAREYCDTIKMSIMKTEE